jgi:hypothetical protein
MTIQAKVATILKSRLAPSGELLPSEKLNIFKGQALQTKRVTAAPNQHLLLELVNCQFDRGYVYAPHWEYEDEEIVLPASYYYQDDNPSGYGFRECCATSNAMMVNYLLGGKFDTDAKQAGISQPEQYYLDALQEEGDTTDHDANTRTIRKFGIESFWSTSLTIEDFYTSIRNGIPMVMGLDYKGPNQGHIVCGVGFKLKKRVAIVHDPNGSRLGATNEWISNEPEAGKFDVYGLETLETLWFPKDEDGVPALGWGRVVTHILGKPTIFAS